MPDILATDFCLAEYCQLHPVDTPKEQGSYVDFSDQIFREHKSKGKLPSFPFFVDKRYASNVNCSRSYSMNTALADVFVAAFCLPKFCHVHVYR